MTSAMELPYRKQLENRGWYRRDIDLALWGMDVFFYYLQDECKVTEYAQVKARHITAYERIIHSWGFDLADAREVLDLNFNLVALKQFCSVMHQAGYLAQDYGKNIRLAWQPPFQPRQEAVKGEMRHG